jgi:hypothetical protein
MCHWQRRSQDSYEVNKGAVATSQGTSPYHLVALLSFDTLDAIKAALTSAEAQEAAADLRASSRKS